MNKYVFIYYGYDTSSPDLEQAWHDWFTLRADHFVDPGNPFGPGREVTRTAATDLSADDTPCRRVLDRPRRNPRRRRTTPRRLPDRRQLSHLRNHRRLTPPRPR